MTTICIIVIVFTVLFGVVNTGEGERGSRHCLLEEELSLLGTIKNNINTLENKLRSHITDEADNTNNSQERYAGGGAIYTRWGRTQCNENGSELVYTGITASTHYKQSGGTDYLCLTTDVTWGNHDDRADGWGGFLYGTEYDIQSLRSNLIFGENIGNHNVPCSVCLSSSRRTVLMIPGRFECIDGWRTEYHGYLMTGHHSHKGSYPFVCMDASPEKITGGGANQDESTLYLVDGICGTLPCPPYVNGREIPCAFWFNGVSVYSFLALESGPSDKIKYQILNSLSLLIFVGGGAIYTRWGRTRCNENGTELVYRITASTHYTHSGGTDYLCLTTDVTWGNHDDRTDGWGGFLYGTEYNIQALRSNLIFGDNLGDQNVPCSVCHSLFRRTVLMIPGRFECIKGWSMEYHGYLMTGHHSHKGSRQFVCIDANPEKTQGGGTNQDESVLLLVDGICGTLPCPPYVNGREIPCVVCTK
ncbi:hypothetical protein ScPMuIL_003582 [Solemya velum]